MLIAYFWPLTLLCLLLLPSVGNTFSEHFDLWYKFLRLIVSHYSPIECLKYILHLYVAQMHHKVTFSLRFTILSGEHNTVFTDVS